ncbi:hypothetical protein [Streptomyces mirabilis]|uniref:hypothetical protein n=1 Tax=Streptomyces mirabilis TaxID=68239 RepID=UPI0036B7171B
MSEYAALNSSSPTACVSACACAVSAEVPLPPAGEAALWTCTSSGQEAVTLPLGLLLLAGDTDGAPADGVCGAAEFPGEDPAHAAVAANIPEQSVRATARRMVSFFRP